MVRIARGNFKSIKEVDHSKGVVKRRVEGKENAFSKELQYYLCLQTVRGIPKGTFIKMRQNIKDIKKRLDFFQLNTKGGEDIKQKKSGGLEQNRKLSYLKKQSASRVQPSGKEKRPYLRFVKAFNSSTMVQNKNIKANHVSSEHSLKRESVESTKDKRAEKTRSLRLGKKTYFKAFQEKKSGDLLLVREQKNDGSSFKNRNRLDGGKDLSFVCTKYEDNIQKLEIRPSTQVHNHINKNADEIFNEIIKQFTFVVKKGGGEARIVLQPEALGNMKINVKIDDMKVNTSIFVDNNALRDLIVSRINLLEQSLLGQGFSLSSFQVEVRDKNTALNMNKQENRKESSFDTKGKNEEGVSDILGSVFVPELPWISTVVNITV